MEKSINHSMGEARPEVEDPGKRKFLSLVPLAVFGAIATSLAASTGRFLAPVKAAAESGPLGAVWKTIASVVDLSGEDPIERTVTVERVSGWVRTVEEETVFVLPQHDNKVLSSVCPHEGCPVVWDRSTRNFLCPCHDSYFGTKGEKLSGPATSDLTELETRVEDGNLQVRI